MSQSDQSRWADLLRPTFEALEKAMLEATTTLESLPTGVTVETYAGSVRLDFGNCQGGGRASNVKFDSAPCGQCETWRGAAKELSAYIKRQDAVVTQLRVELERQKATYVAIKNAIDEHDDYEPPPTAEHIEQHRRWVASPMGQMLTSIERTMFDAGSDTQPTGDPDDDAHE